MIVSIYRRDPRGRWVAVDHVDEPTLDEAFRYYQETYLHDDANGTEIMFAYSDRTGTPRVELRRVSVPPSRPTLTVMHWE